MKRALFFSLVLAVVPGSIAAMDASHRPLLRPVEPNVPIAASSFDSWVTGFKERARAAGISSPVLEKAFEGVRYDPEVIRRDRNQSEFTKTIWDYLDTAVSDARIRNGKAALSRWGSVLEKIETQYGVSKEIVVAIWGLESAYGAVRGKKDVISSLATLASDTRRGAFFEGQLLAALRILEAGDVAPRNMTGSWAGAMGHTQFIPTSFEDYAVDFDGNGKRNIWSDDPVDALASTANYLATFGWNTNQPWGVEVTVPEGFDYTLADREITRSASDWQEIGVTATTGRAIPDHGPASILLPAGHSGAAFMIFENFEVLERYNTADAYVIGVGHLADRISGKPAIQGDWPTSDRALTLDERMELQRRLTAAGHPTKEDGKIGPLTIASIRAFQVANEIVPDGYASLEILNILRTR